MTSLNLAAPLIERGVRLMKGVLLGMALGLAASAYGQSAFRFGPMLKFAGGLGLAGEVESGRIVLHAEGGWLLLALSASAGLGLRLGESGDLYARLYSFSAGSLFGGGGTIVGLEPGLRLRLWRRLHLEAGAFLWSEERERFSETPPARPTSTYTQLRAIPNIGLIFWLLDRRR